MTQVFAIRGVHVTRADACVIRRRREQLVVAARATAYRVQGDFPARESEAGDDTIGTPAFSGSLEDPRHGIGLAACSDIALFDAVR